MDTPPHAERIERAFTTQAEAFEDPARNRVFTADARWVFERLPLSTDDVVLDVAAGTGHAARQLAETARAVVALDATEAMLARGQAQAVAEGRDNVVFMRGDAADLPFLDASFDVVVSRFAAHHLERPEAVVAEMARCTRPGGPCGARGPGGRRGPGDRRGAEPAGASARPVPHADAGRDRDPGAAHRGRARGRRRGHAPPAAAAPALARAGTDAGRGPRGEIRAALEADVAGERATGFRPRTRRRTATLWFVQTFGSAIADKPA